MRKSFVVVALLLSFLFVFASMAMAEDEGREGNIVLKVGVFVPTNDEFDTLSAANWSLEGEYIIYSTEYLDVSAIGGYYRTNLPNALFSNLAANIDTFYYMGGVKIYPTKKDFYFGGFIGGATNSIDPDADSATGLAYKACAGYEYKQFIVEVSFLAQSNEDLTYNVNHNVNRTNILGQPVFQSNQGVQIMGGYKFQ